MTTPKKQGPTPGPWEFGDPDVHGRKVYGPVVDDYADPGELAVIAEGMTEPNARLIAAAPEMLEALRLLAHWKMRDGRPCFCPAGENEAEPTGRMPTVHSTACGEARAAIAKAEGSR